jgi:serine/threonine-protein kinase
MPSDPSLIGRVVADRYQILSLIGEGGMGRVYLTEHVRMGRRSAVKVMSPNLALSADAISRFNREAANAAKINHPNVAQIYDFGETDDGLLYLAMELVEGETLREIIERDGPMPLERAAALTTQIAGALAAAHHLGIVHRDLKPDNIMVGRHHDGSDWVKVVDFGIAKTVQRSGESGGSQTVTTAGVSLGTPEYMSPEQLAGEQLDSRTDLYSLALVFFNMATADRPFPKVTSRETLVHRLTSPPRALSQVAPERLWPAALQRTLDRALAPHAHDRYESVVDFAREISTSIAEPSSAPTRRMTPPIATRPVARRTRLIAPALIVSGVLLLGAAGAGYALYQSRPHREPATVASAPVPVQQPISSPPAPATTRDSSVAKVGSIPDSAAKVVRRAARPDRMGLLVKKIRAHAGRAGLMIDRADVGGARAELRALANEVQTFRALYPAAADSLGLNQQIQREAMMLIQRCMRAVADSTQHFPPNFRCEQLLPGPGRGRQGRAAELRTIPR